MKGSPYGCPSRVSSPLTGHPTTYGKFVMDKYMKAENTLERYLSDDSSVFIPYFSKILTLDKEEEI